MSVQVKVENSESMSKEDVLREVDAEVERFSAFMAGLNDWKAAGPLSNPEKALLRTYLLQKEKGTF